MIENTNPDAPECDSQAWWQYNGYIPVNTLLIKLKDQSAFKIEQIYNFKL